MMAKVLATFRISETDWNDFKALADSKGSNASSELVKFIGCSLGRIEGSLETVNTENLDKRIANYLETNLDNYLAPLIETAIRFADLALSERALLKTEIQPILDSYKEFEELMGK